MVPTPTKLASTGSGGAEVPHDAEPPVELPVELDPLLELLDEPLVVPTKPVLLEDDPLVVPNKPVELDELLEELLELLEELLDELLLLEELLLEELELLPEVELLLDDELAPLVLPCPLLAFPLEPPPTNIAIAMASSEGKLAPSSRPGTSSG